MVVQQYSIDEQEKTIASMAKMKYCLKHKNITVLEMEIDNEASVISKVTRIMNPNHIPFGVRLDKEIIDRKALNHWLKGRSIPASRDNIDKALETIGELSTQNLIVKCYGLSLSDCYWICPKDMQLDFNQINFFENEFSRDMGEILFGKHLDSFSLISPDNTSDGWLKKKWMIKNGKRYLMKGASGVYRQEPFNEKIANLVCEKLDILHVKYEVEFIDEMPYSICENFLSKDTELVSAWSIYSHFKKPNHLSAYEHLIESYEKIGVKDARQSLEKMLVLDFLIANTDRHMNNFGIVRDSNNLDVLGVAPLFDSGTSMFMSSPLRLDINDVESKPFTKKHSEQIKLVINFDEFNMKNLQHLSENVGAVLDKNSFIDEARKNFILDNFSERVAIVTKMAQKQT